MLLQVTLWRRSFATPPPDMPDDHEFSITKDRRYNHVPRDQLPRAESLKTTIDRVLPYVCARRCRLSAVLQTVLTRSRFRFWNSDIVPSIKSGKRVIIAAHGNSLRALVKHLDDISDDDIIPVNIPTGAFALRDADVCYLTLFRFVSGVPLVYELDENLKPIPHPDAIAPLSGRYLGDPEALAAEIAAVAAQASAKK